MDTMKLVGAVLVAAVLAGCGHSPVAVKAAGEPELRLSLKALKLTNATKPVPMAEATTPPWVLAKNAEVAARAAAQKAAATPKPVASPKAAAKATPKPIVTPAPAAPAAHDATTAPRLLLIAQPDPLNVSPTRDEAGAAIEVVSAPLDGLARFEVQAPAEGVLVAKVKIEVLGAAHTETVELPIADLNWPAKLAYGTELAVPVGLAETLKVLNQDPTAKQLTLRATPIGPDGVALTGADGKPLALVVRVNVK